MEEEALQLKAMLDAEELLRSLWAQRSRAPLRLQDIDTFTKNVAPLMTKIPIGSAMLFATNLIHMFGSEGYFIVGSLHGELIKVGRPDLCSPPSSSGQEPHS